MAGGWAGTSSFGFQQQHPRAAIRGVPALAASQLEETTTTRALPPPRTWVQRPGWPPKPSSSTKDDEGQEHRGLLNGSSSEPPARPKQRRRQKTKPMPVTGYDSRAIEEFYDMRPFQVGWRLNSLGFPLLGWYLRLLLDKMLGIDSDVEVQRRRGAELREHLVRSKSVALIKSGQALSLRPDLIRNRYWAEELGKLVDAVGSFSDVEAMKIMRKELEDLAPRLKVSKATWQEEAKQRMRNRKGRLNKLQKMVESDPILSLFEFDNDNIACASASLGQVYKARIRKGRQLEAAIGPKEAAIWGGRVVAIKVQRPDVEASAALDMYLLRRTSTWLSKVRGGNLPKIADAFGMQLFGELDYIREANNVSGVVPLWEQLALALH